MLAFPAYYRVVGSLVALPPSFSPQGHHFDAGLAPENKQRLLLYHIDFERAMETYTGTKFKCIRVGETFPYDDRLAELNRWAYILAELGLTPVHTQGAFGNQSHRTGDHSFIITKSGMVPEKDLVPDNFVLIEQFNRESGIFMTRGRCEPSSESILHAVVYQAFPDAGSIFHGHSRLLEQHAVELGIPVTPVFHSYGTVELAESALSLLQQGNDFIYMKKHGFVATGTDLAGTGKKVLDTYRNLIDLLGGQ